MILKPSEIFYSQDSINNVFDRKSSHGGKRFGSTLDDIIEGRCAITDIPVISVCNINGKWFTADNRRLWVFKKLEDLGKCNTIKVFPFGYVSPRKFTTINGGISIRVRGDPGGQWLSKPNYIPKPLFCDVRRQHIYAGQTSVLDEDQNNLSQIVKSMDTLQIDRTRGVFDTSFKNVASFPRQLTLESKSASYVQTPASVYSTLYGSRLDHLPTANHYDPAEFQHESHLNQSFADNTRKGSAIKRQYEVESYGLAKEHFYNPTTYQPPSTNLSTYLRERNRNRSIISSNTNISTKASELDRTFSEYENYNNGTRYQPTTGFFSNIREPQFGSTLDRTTNNDIRKTLAINSNESPINYNSEFRRQLTTREERCNSILGQSHYSKMLSTTSEGKVTSHHFPQRAQQWKDASDRPEERQSRVISGTSPSVSKRVTKMLTKSEYTGMSNSVQRAAQQRKDEVSARSRLYHSNSSSKPEPSSKTRDADTSLKHQEGDNVKNTTQQRKDNVSDIPRFQSDLIYRIDPLKVNYTNYPLKIDLNKYETTFRSLLQDKSPSLEPITVHKYRGQYWATDGNKRLYVFRIAARYKRNITIRANISNDENEFLRKMRKERPMSFFMKLVCS